MTTTRTMNTFLSKSRYMLGLQCPKALWLNNYRPELKDEVSDSQEAVFQSGTDVGVLARDIFPGGVEIPYDGLTTTEQLARTRQLLDDGVTTLYEAAFSHDGVFVKVDLLHKGRGGWELHEVKGSTGMKDVYLDDFLSVHRTSSGSPGVAAAAAGGSPPQSIANSGQCRSGEVFEDTHLSALLSGFRDHFHDAGTAL